MSEAIGFGLFMVWLGLGGWSFARLDHGKDVGLAFWMCMLFGPFVFGIAIAQRRAPQPKEGKTE